MEQQTTLELQAPATDPEKHLPHAQYDGAGLYGTGPTKQKTLSLSSLLPILRKTGQRYLKVLLNQGIKLVLLER
jgi:hypothetical protein